MNPSTAAASSSSSSSSSSSWFSGIVRGRSTKGATSSTGGVAVPFAGDASGTGHRKNQLPGVLFKYGPKSVQVAFRTGDFNQQVIFLGGLTDGFLATEYVEPLAVALENENWSLVQPLLSSSYIGYGTSTLELDALELNQLIGYLINKENSEGVVLLGHSTGCQDIVHYMRTNFTFSRAVRGVILQAPVSDREYRAMLPETAEMIDLALSMMNEGRALELMPRQANPDAPITAYRQRCLYLKFGSFNCSKPLHYSLVVNDEGVFHFEVTDRLNLGLLQEYTERSLSPQQILKKIRMKVENQYHSLCAYMGDDDMFSSDLSEDQLRTILGHMSNTPCQVIFSMADEFVPEYVDKKTLVERLCRAMGGAEKVEIEHGNHSLSNRVQEAVQAILDFVKREGPKGWDDPWH
ncbi:hypothetical protein IEQ34_005195 [Dendrobium chrysotoxum]|uniref:Uncharacterized protein n=1 Tax=Dendrobium chrysotoxum TaxID=161865 RepID=A0AAV7HB44_DENCH|nr:hypothetical protein IEQ34_005195 [Dendrobium chrysotoxum]